MGQQSRAAKAMDAQDRQAIALERIANALERLANKFSPAGTVKPMVFHDDPHSPWVEEEQTDA